MLALIAGQGALPAELLARLSPTPLICALSGSEPDQVVPELIFRLETLGSFLQELKARGVTTVCMAGGVRRPVVDPAAIDAQTLPLVPVIQAALATGDDGALRAVIGIFEDAGLDVRAAQDIAPELLLDEGIPTARVPDDRARQDATRAAAIMGAMAQADVGQSCAVRNGQALAIEGVFGTEWMLASLQARPDGPGGLLFKAPKAGQDRRVDLPAIGLDTVDQVMRAGLDGIVLEAGSVIILNREEVIAACDRLGLYLWLRKA